MPELYQNLFDCRVNNGTASAGVFGYDNYWDCILDQMPGVQNDVAAGAVMRQCHVQAPNRLMQKSVNEPMN